jgi:PhnB protein
MAAGKQKPRGSRGSVARKTAKTAKPKKAAGAAAVPRDTASSRGTVAKRAAASKSATTRKKKVAAKTVSPVIPYLTVRDVQASLVFYEQAFGFKRGETISLPDGSLVQVVMHHARAAAVKLSPEGLWSGSMKAPATSRAENPIVLYVPCRKVDELAARARAAGATIASEPEDMFWGERIVRIVDPDGYLWCFAARIGKFDPAKIPRGVEADQASISESPQNPAAEPVSEQVSNAPLDFEL